MVDWFTWPADLLLSAGGIVASWFVSKNASGFVPLQMGFALVVLAVCRIPARIFATVNRILAVASRSLGGGL
jgi:hypothetical protein